MSARIIPLRKEESLSDTTRSYPRTLHGPLAAFPRDPEHANAVHIPRIRQSEHAWWRYIAIIAAAIAIGGFAAIVFGGQP